jgi:outer membrane protein TolC
MPLRPLALLLVAGLPLTAQAAEPIAADAATEAATGTHDDAAPADVGRAAGAYDLDACLRMALERGPEMMQKQEDLSIAKERVWQAYSSFAPSVVFQPQVISQTPLVDFEDDLGGVFGQIPSGFGGGFPGGNTGSNIPSPNTPTITGFPSEIVTAGVIAQIPIVAGGKRVLGVRLAHTHVELEQSLIRDTGHRTSYRVAQTYLGILAGEATSALLASIHAELETIIEDTRALKARGFLTDADVLDVEASLADVEAQQAQSAADLEAAKLGLKLLMGLPSDAPLTLLGKLDEKLEAPTDSVPELLSVAKDRRTDLAARRLQLQLAQQQVWLKRADLPFVPTLALQLEGGIRGTKIPYLLTNWSKTFGPYYQAALVLKVPLFDGVDSLSKVDEAKATVRKASMGVEQTAALIDNEVRRYHAAVAARQRALESINLVVQARQERYRVADASFRAGDLSRSEFLREYVALVEARTRRAGTLYQLRQALLDLDAASGQLPRTASEVGGPPPETTADAPATPAEQP